MKKILVVRNDKIGDFILAWPSFAMLKNSLPSVQIDALVPAYTKPLAELCPWIDNVIIDSDKKEDQKHIIVSIKIEKYTDYICLFSNTRNAQLGRKAKIPYRLAPATKWAQFLYTDKLKQRRSQSAKPEFEYNLDLIRYFLKKRKAVIIEPEAPFLQVDKKIKTALKTSLISKFNDSVKQLYFVHAGSGGSATNLSVEQYSTLINGLNEKIEYVGFVLTAGPGEKKKAQELQNQLNSKVQSYLYESKDGLISFCQTISCADLFIAGSTGPLHIAGACDVPTVGFFPSKRSATPLRWKPLNSQGKHIAFTGNNEKYDVLKINIEDTIEKIKISFNS